MKQTISEHRLAWWAKKNVCVLQIRVSIDKFKTFSIELKAKLDRCVDTLTKLRLGISILENIN